MIHELDTLLWYFGDIARVYGFSTTGATGDTTVDYAQALLRFQSGVIAHVEASWAHAGFRTRFEIAGEHGILAHDSEESASLRRDIPGNDLIPARIERRTSSPYRPYHDQLRHFIDRLNDGKPFLVDGEQGRRALVAARAVQESARTGQPVFISADGSIQPEGVTR
jgi:UDP-N-acetylglucosamine 3-dehydrogenase